MIISKHIPYDGVNNTRDLGGMKTKDGATVKDGFLFRGGMLFNASDKDKEHLTSALDLVVDFRSDQEVLEKPDPELEGIDNFHIPILEQRAAGVTREKKTDEQIKLPSYNTVEEAKAIMSRVYRRFVESDYSRSQYEKFMRLVMDGKYERILWHCTAGKDRTGFAAMVLQRILGIEDDVIMEDYLITNMYLVEEVAEIKARIRAREGVEIFPPEKEQALTSLFGAEKEYLLASWNAIDELYGDFHTFLVDGLHVTDEEQEMFRKRYLN